jgi:hypothetical protein
MTLGISRQYLTLLRAGHPQSDDGDDGEKGTQV